jgi:hypothetical protein
LTAHSLSKLQLGNYQTCSYIKKSIEAKVKPEINIGKTISFCNSIQQSNKYLWNNWHDTEAWGVWSNGKRASLYFPRPEGVSGSFDLTLKALITGKHPSQIVRVKVNGEVTKIQVSSVEEQIFRIPISSVTNDFIWIEIETPDAVSPENAGLMGGDKRKLGIGLISIAFN